MSESVRTNAILLSIDPDEENPVDDEPDEPEKCRKYKTPTATSNTMFRMIEMFFIFRLKFKAANITILLNFQELNR